MLKKITSLFLFITVLVSGCKDISNTIDNSSIKTNIIQNATNKIALICSLTKVDPNAYDGWNGDCPGTDIDANIFAGFCKQHNIPYIQIQNEQCTCQNIIDLWLSCVKQLNPTNSLFIFFYSGHGGQVYCDSDSIKYEEDGLDETLCLWDGQFVDDDVWYLINQVPKTSRVFMVTDCCNSETNFRVPQKIAQKISKPYNLGNSKSLKSRGGNFVTRLFTNTVEPNMIHYGGCEDGKSSYGSNKGGVFTSGLKVNYNKDITYEQWFNKAKQSLKNTYQTPTFSETGKSFKTTKIFE